MIRMPHRGGEDGYLFNSMASSIDGSDIYFRQRRVSAEGRRLDSIEGRDPRFEEQKTPEVHRLSSIVGAGSLALAAYALVGDKATLRVAAILGAALGGVSSYAIFKSENKGDI